MNVDKIVEDITNYFENIELEKEKLINLSRSITRDSKHVIHSIQNGKDFSDVRKKMKKDVDSIKENQINLYAPVRDSLYEYAEAELFYYLVKENKLPSPKEIGVIPQCWIMGLADCVGELRRMIVSYLMESKYEESVSLFKTMEEISHIVLTCDVSDSIVPLRRKQDIIRGVLDKTRSDILNAKLFSENSFKTH